MIHNGFDGPPQLAKDAKSKDEAMDHHRRVGDEIKGESGTGNLCSHTAGFQAEGQALDYRNWGATFAAQLGDYGEDTIRAYGANGKLGFTFSGDWSPRRGRGRLA